jgi:AraC-like DNA-binding protein
MDAALLDLPVRRDESELAAFLDGAPGKIAMLYRRDREIARSVREALASSLADPASFAMTARRLHISPRSLHRRLAAEGTSYRAIKDAVRREGALQRLEKTDLSVAEIAAALGYSEPSAFFRAFVAWTGAAPSLYRKRNKRPKIQQISRQRSLES